MSSTSSIHSLQTPFKLTNLARMVILNPLQNNRQNVSIHYMIKNVLKICYYELYINTTLNVSPIHNQIASKYGTYNRDCKQVFAKCIIIYLEEPIEWYNEKYLFLTLP
jgi:hypothetical protein